MLSFSTSLPPLRCPLPCSPGTWGCWAGGAPSTCTHQCRGGGQIQEPKHGVDATIQGSSSQDLMWFLEGQASHGPGVRGCAGQADRRTLKRLEVQANRRWLLFLCQGEKLKSRQAT